MKCHLWVIYSDPPWPFPREFRKNLPMVKGKNSPPLVHHSSTANWIIIRIHCFPMQKYITSCTPNFRKCENSPFNIFMYSADLHSIWYNIYNYIYILHLFVSSLIHVVFTAFQQLPNSRKNHPTSTAASWQLPLQEREEKLATESTVQQEVLVEGVFS